MDKILGLGTAGCNIASCFEKYPQYVVRKVDCERKEEDNYICIIKQDSPENYELFCPNLQHQLEALHGDLLFIVSGASLISGAALSLLSQLKDMCSISVLYIKPGNVPLHGVKKKQENAVYNIFQEYARSGVFKQLYVVDNSCLESILEDVPVVGYYDKLNDLIVSTIHMINVLDNTDPVASTFCEIGEASRICTFAISNMDGSEKTFFPLDNVVEKRYYYAIPEERLKTDGTILKMIRQNLNDAEGATYAIYESTYDSEYVYGILRSNLIQKDEKSV